MKKILLLFICIFCTTIFQAQSLKLEEIMKGNDFIGNLPENERWSLDGSTIYFDWNPSKEWGNSTYYWKKGMKAPQKASKEEAIAEFLQHPSDNPSNERMMPNLGITADEAKGLVAFLKHMSSIDTNGFPRNFGKIEGGIHGR